MVILKRLSRGADYARYLIRRDTQPKYLHINKPNRYPNTPTLPLPTNLLEIVSNETGRFTVERSRDMAMPVLMYRTQTSEAPFSRGFADNSSGQLAKDSHLDSYDCFGAISLNSSMQTNVPKPFSSHGKSTHLNMPGGQCAMDSKYIADTLQSSHYAYRRFDPSNLSIAKLDAAKRLPRFHSSKMHYSTKAEIKPKSEPSGKPTRRMIKSTDKEFSSLPLKVRIKVMIKEYGYTVVVFHISLSLLSLGIFYVAVSNGINVEPFIAKMISIDNEKWQNMLVNSSTFVIAYTAHKMTAPARIAITFTTVPLLVRYLRRIGVYKTKVPSAK